MSTPFELFVFYLLQFCLKLGTVGGGGVNPLSVKYRDIFLALSTHCKMRPDLSAATRHRLCVGMQQAFFFQKCDSVPLITYGGICILITSFYAYRVVVLLV